MPICQATLNPYWSVLLHESISLYFKHSDFCKQTYVFYRNFTVLKTITKYPFHLWKISGILTDLFLIDQLWKLHCFLEKHNYFVKFYEFLVLLRIFFTLYFCKSDRKFHGGFCFSRALFKFCLSTKSTNIPKSCFHMDFV